MSPCVLQPSSIPLSSSKALKETDTKDKPIDQERMIFA